VTAPAGPADPVADPAPAPPRPSAGHTAGARSLSPRERPALRRAVLAWYARRGRRLGFRVPGGAGPWGVLVSEVMAQQTQVARVDERWPGFMAEFPTPAAMAAATPADVLRAWRGLGYNRRAIGLHRAAVAIVAGGGAVPDDVDALAALPGVGPYTARAVAAIAFGRPVAPVDVNVRRVVGRIVAGDPALISSKRLQEAADALVDPLRPGTWTHALMDLGATTCRAARPACVACPARRWCAAAEAGAEAGASPASVRPASRRPAVPFERSSRWLRGRIVDRLRDAPRGQAVAFDGPVGQHSRAAVAAALRALERDGVVELGRDGRARLPGDR
jgi:A/G-specific adenine glycosylase